MSSTEPSKIDLFKHLGMAITALILIILFVFYIYLPFTTNHGESLTVPNLEGIALEELEEYLEERDLRYEVEADSGYSAKYAPLVVLKQFPKANAKVKENRKIYVTLNATTAPVVKMPNLIDKSLKNAQLELRSLGLTLGAIRYKSAFALNTILGQFYNGKPIAEGSEVPKGSKIDFDVRDGQGNQTFQMMDLSDMELEEAIFVMRGYGLKLGDVFYEKEGNIQKENREGVVEIDTNPALPGRIFKQSPTSKRKARIGMEIDIWVVEVDSAALSTSPTLDLSGD